MFFIYKKSIVSLRHTILTSLVIHAQARWAEYMGATQILPEWDIVRNLGRNRYPPIFRELQRIVDSDELITRRSPNQTYPSSYRQLPAIKPHTSFENADASFSGLHRHMGRISTEPLVVPVRVVVYVIEAECATNQSDKSISDTSKRS